MHPAGQNVAGHLNAAAGRGQRQAMMRRLEWSFHEEFGRKLREQALI